MSRAHPPAIPALLAPPAAELVAPPHWACIDLLSDLHLQAGLSRTAAAFRDHLAGTPAQAVIILGDLFEVWVGDDAAADGFEQTVGQWLCAASGMRWVGFMAGNRDFLVGPDFLRSCGMQALDDPTVLEAFGRRYLLTHGDALCLDDVEYQRFRAEVRNPAWRERFLAQPLAVRRQIAAQLRAASEERKRRLGREAYADVDPDAALRWLEAARAHALIHGHTHRPADTRLDAAHHCHVLSDWDLDEATDGAPAARAEVLRLTAAGLQRVPIAPGDR